MIEEIGDIAESSPDYAYGGFWSGSEGRHHQRFIAPIPLRRYRQNQHSGDRQRDYEIEHAAARRKYPSPPVEEIGKWLGRLKTERKRVKPKRTKVEIPVERLVQAGETLFVGLDESQFSERSLQTEMGVPSHLVSQWVSDFSRAAGVGKTNELVKLRDAGIWPTVTFDTLDDVVI